MQFVIVILIVSVILNGHAELINPCHSRVYCYGPLLHTIQVSQIFNDSKRFVDMKMKNSYNVTLSNFDKFMKATNRTPSKTDIQNFVKDNFEDGDELEMWKPPDYNDNPNFLKKINDLVVKDFATELIELWPMLAKKVKPDVRKNSQQYSFISVPNGFIIPGGRFKEYYYWDSYWIIKGLLVCEMNETVKGILDNFIHIIKLFKFIPNGGRIYYLNRSHPPLLTKMVMEYFKYSKDKRWLKENIKYLEKELQFWLTKRTINIHKNNCTYVMAHYNSESNGPRPESYIKDLRTAEFYPDPYEKDELYKEIKSGAESGWDFSSRWIFDKNGGNSNNLTGIETRRVVPVDLNSFLCEAFKSLSYLYSELLDYNNTIYWHEMSMRWQKSIEEVLWNNEDGIWYDYDIKLSKQRKYFYPSNVAPLWSNCFDKYKGETLGMRVLKYLSDSGAFDTNGGIGTSSIESGEQWDFPNAWAPLQALIVQGLDQSGAPNAIKKAKVVASEWLKANIRGFMQSGEMFEKYDAIHPGKYGGGGEYPVQSGFGWSNGIALEFINKYFTKGDLENDV